MDHGLLQLGEAPVSAVPDLVLRAIDAAKGGLFVLCPHATADTALLDLLGTLYSQVALREPCYDLVPLLPACGWTAGERAAGCTSGRMAAARARAGLLKGTFPGSAHRRASCAGSGQAQGTHKRAACLGLIRLLLLSTDGVRKPCCGRDCAGKPEVLSPSAASCIKT